MKIPLNSEFNAKIPLRTNVAAFDMLTNSLSKSSKQTFFNAGPMSSSKARFCHGLVCKHLSLGNLIQVCLLAENYKLEMKHLHLDMLFFPHKVYLDLTTLMVSWHDPISFI